MSAKLSKQGRRNARDVPGAENRLAPKKSENAGRRKLKAEVPPRSCGYPSSSPLPSSSFSPPHDVSSIHQVITMLEALWEEIVDCGDSISTSYNLSSALQFYAFT